jgi:hypothetical protein
MIEIPSISGIHTAVYTVASATPKALDMGNWHTCETTHCRAGWVVHLAGDAGMVLEKETSTLFAAMQIYKKSDPINRVSPVRFFEKNDVALADMKRLAEVEASQSLTSK